MSLEVLFVVAGAFGLIDGRLGFMVLLIFGLLRLLGQV